MTRFPHWTPIRRALHAIAHNRTAARLAALQARARQWLPYHLDCIIPCLLVSGVAVMCAALMLHKAGSVLALLKSGPGAHSKPIAVQRIYLDRKDYLEYAPTMTRLNPGVSFAVDQASATLTLTINDEELFPDLMMALHTLQSFRPGVAWDMSELCVKTCPDKAIARVAVKGFKQELR